MSTWDWWWFSFGGYIGCGLIMARSVLASNIEDDGTFQDEGDSYAEATFFAIFWPAVVLFLIVAGFGLYVVRPIVMPKAWRVAKLKARAAKIEKARVDALTKAVETAKENKLPFPGGTRS